MMYFFRYKSKHESLFVVLNVQCSVTTVYHIKHERELLLSCDAFINRLFCKGPKVQLDSVTILNKIKCINGKGRNTDSELKSKTQLKCKQKDYQHYKAIC